MTKKIALIGNPNCGKTTLFNNLTGTYQKTGNWTGVTTQVKSAKYVKDNDIDIYDLPGVYSLEANSLDEQSVIDYIRKTPPDVIINVVDGTNLERNLFLTAQLCKLKIPFVIAVNYIDELEDNGIKLDEYALSKLFNVSVVSISALKKIRTDKLINKAISVDTISDQTCDFNIETRAIYNFIEKNIDKIITKKLTRNEKFTQKADNILLSKVFAIPVFVIVMLWVYFISIKFGGVVGQGVNHIILNLTKTIEGFLFKQNVPNILIGLTCDAILKGMATVFSFLPQILILFMFLTILEESGYASRIAFILDKVFRAVGLSGKSVIPLIVSCGCTVTGLSSSRTIENLSERRMTIFLTPFMPCGAKLAVFAWFASVFFDGSALVATSMYFLALTCTAVFGAILKNFKPFKQNNGELLIEIPTLRAPSFHDVLSVLKEKVKDFVTKAGMIVFLVSVGLWFLQNIGPSGYVNGNQKESFLFVIGDMLKFIFYPLGFGNWQASVAIISGTFAKEAVVETLCLICEDYSSIFYNQFSVYAFMAFVLLSPPCVASLATAKRELVKPKWFLGMLIFQFLSAYLVAFTINAIGFFIECNFGLILSVFIGIITLILAITFAIKLKSKRCKLCKVCHSGGKECQNHKKRYTT